MNQNVNSYIDEVSDKYKTGRAGEHAYRPTFEKLVKAINKNIAVINDPKRTEYGAPDFIFVTGDLIAGYAETKDINTDLDKTENTEQIKRYLGYSNLILTNYLEFRFFRNGERYGNPIVIGKIVNGIVHVQKEYASFFESTIADFLTAKPEAIKSGVRLAKIMGGKARRIRDNVDKFLSNESEKNAEIMRVYGTIKKLLVHDLTRESFADMYAQTLVYGLFAARYYDETPANFTRQEARDLIPASNPFLRHFFDHIAGADFDKRLGYIVNELCEVFSHANVNELMEEYFKKDSLGESHKGPDPVIHFYEDFLKEYDPVLRKKMGAYYTPLPVVQFIVRSVDYLLKKEFGLEAGLSDTSKLTNGIHRVQILDPAVGTGTFISAVINIIYSSLLKNGQKGRWPAYAHNDLLPRLHGFELMMAPYTIAHLKLAMAFGQTGFKYFNRRLGIYLTNSLEKAIGQGELFTAFGLAESIAKESKEAAVIKDETPIMVVIGNPPYSVSSSNKGKWIQNLIKEYKKNLNEKKINLDDDYIKFIRLSENFIEKNKSGIVAMITNNSFIYGITHRQMRKHLLENFDDIYILDLHGDSKKKEKTPEGKKDENVFNIRQGVSINIFIRKKEKKNDLGTVYHSEIYGKRDYKFKILNESKIQNIKWKKLDYKNPYYFFIPKDFGMEMDYKKGFKLDELFPVNSSGIETQNDAINIFFKEKKALSVLKDFLNLPKTELVIKYKLKDGRDWKAETAKADLVNNSILTNQIQYRPFDLRFTNYTGTTKGIMSYPRYKVMKNLFKNNYGLIFKRGFSEEKAPPVFVSNNIIDRRSWSRSGMQGAEIISPLYLYLENGLRLPNLKKELVDEIEKIVGEVTPEDILDYIYAVLHSPSYREKYKEFLKIDFPRVPYPTNLSSFKKLVSLGAELRLLHLFELPKLGRFITTYPNDGSNIVEKLVHKDGNVYINEEQYFGNVPEIAWNFYIGGYQPAQKWLKDRKGRTLTNSELEHYQKIIIALKETDRIMKEIDKYM